MKTALITGASSGIGKELAYLLAKEKYHLILVARRDDLLNSLAKECEEKFEVDSTVIKHDLSKQDSGVELYNTIKEMGITVDVLINNAGFGDNCEFATSSLEKNQRMIHLNMLSLTELTHKYVNEMIVRNSGMIMNVASTAAFQAMPKFSVYAATKAYVLHLTEAIHFELKNTSVHITALCPGATKTGFEQAAEMMGSKLFEKNAMTAKQVAGYGLNALKKNKMYAIPGFKNRVLTFMADGTPIRRLKVWVSSKVT